MNFTEFRTVTREDYAVYGQGTYRLNDTFSITAGVRYQDEDQFDEGGAFFSTRADRTTKASKVTWKVGVDVNLTEDNLVYGLVSTGWKNGGSQGGGLFLPMQFQPEEVTAFELGARNTFLDGRVHLNVTAFYYDHEHLQFTYEDPQPFDGGTGTIPETEEYGIESELSWLVADGWQLDGMLAWQDGKVKSDFFALDVEDFRAATALFQLGLFIPCTPPGFPPGSCMNTGPTAVDIRQDMAEENNLKGNKPPKLVDLTARVALTNTHTFSDGSELSSRVEYVHRGDFQARIFNHPRVDSVPSYDLVNLYFAYDVGNMPISFNLSVTNVFDKNGINNVFTNPYGLWTTSNEYIPPREVIGSVRYSWN